MRNLYLDYNASTPIDPEVLKAMEPFLSHHFGNPSTQHWAAVEAKHALVHAREQVSRLLGCQAEEVIFTSGGSESNNHLLKGVYFALRNKGNHIITTAVEHPAILNPCRFLESIGAKVTYVAVDRHGRVSPEDIRKAITSQTLLISVMHANNEVGTIQPIEEISAIARQYGILFHSDASQSVGKIPAKVDELGVDFLTIAGHKLYAPKGVGALYIRQGVTLEPLIHGAGHENGRRAGTENVPYAVGLGKACELADKDMDIRQMTELRDYFWAQLKAHFQEGIVLNGHPEQRLPNTLSVSFPGRAGSDILQQMPEIAASTGSACHSGIVELSSVLQAMGVNEHTGMGTIRFSLGRYTTKEEIDGALSLLKERVDRK